MANSWFHHPVPIRAAPHFYKPHPHAHHIGFAAAIVGILAVPTGAFIVPAVLAIGLGVTAILLSLHPAPGLNARPEGWAAIVLGLLGLSFGALQMLLLRSM